MKQEIIMKRKHVKYFLVLYLALNTIFAQQKYLDVQDIKEEWKNFTSFQRQELVAYNTVTQLKKVFFQGVKIQ